MTEECSKLHKLFSSMRRFSFPFNEHEIPKDGIYIVFENGEKAHGVDRIVRIGTHNGENQLISRLRQHFINENKDRSIFRKNIGRAILARENDSFIKSWEIDLTTKKSKQDNKDIDLIKQKEIENKVTNYMQSNFNFVVFEIKDKTKRLELESKIISTISLCPECCPSKTWLGLNSPKEKIRKNGLWLVNELFKTPFSKEELERFVLIVI